jgi:hypothetical protein
MVIVGVIGMLVGAYFMVRALFDCIFPKEKEELPFFLRSVSRTSARTITFVWGSLIFLFALGMATGFIDVGRK